MFPATDQLSQEDPFRLTGGSRGLAGGAAPPSKPPSVGLHLSRLSPWPLLQHPVLGLASVP